MMKTLNHHYSNPNTTAKTAEIMSRYRPIAPRPETSPASDDNNLSPSLKINQSPYLRNLWPQLQARPTRSRKRGRPTIFTPPPPPQPNIKRTKTHPFFSLSPPSTNLSLHQPFPTHHHRYLPNLVTLPLLPCSPEPTKTHIDLNKSAAVEVENNLTQEKDVLLQLHVPCTVTIPKVISPRPIRPVGSSISVGCINECMSLVPPLKTPEEVEKEVELDEFPVVISDSKNRIRVVNSAYKEMVGEPECPWLDTMMGPDTCKRICGEVMLRFCGGEEMVRFSGSNGFSCRVRIEWERDDKKCCVDAYCDVMRLVCHSKDYVFTWKFHTGIREGSHSGSCSK